MSHHLKVLSQAGLVEAQREGNAIFYRRPLNLDDDFDSEAITQILSLIDRFELSDDILNKISEYKINALASLKFFLHVMLTVSKLSKS
jgi:ArsR family transcriptional regulator